MSKGDKKQSIAVIHKLTATIAPTQAMTPSK